MLRDEILLHNNASLTMLLATVFPNTSSEWPRLTDQGLFFPQETSRLLNNVVLFLNYPQTFPKQVQTQAKSQI